MAATKNILVVEDDGGIRETLGLMLEVEGYRVLPAANGAEAIDILAHENDISLILLDLMMPVMNGWEFAERVQQNQKWSSIPIILITAFSSEAGKIKGVRLILPKPVDIELLMQTVRRYVHDSEGQSRAA